MSDESLIAGIWTKDAIKGLEKTIKQSNEENDKLQKRIFWLTIITTILTFTQVVDIFLRWSGVIK